MNFNLYRSFIFDCDGVILNSNKIKTQAFYNAALPYGQKAANELVRYHVSNGGISRYRKFEYFLSNIVDKNVQGPSVDQLLSSYAAEVKRSLIECNIADGLDELRKAYPNSNWMIVSGGDQSELREIFNLRHLDSLFNAGIFGSPDTKDSILSTQKKLGNIIQPAVFFGDSRYDEEAAKNAGLSFVFVSGWSESSYLFPHADHQIVKLLDLLPR